MPWSVTVRKKNSDAPLGGIPKEGEPLLQRWAFGLETIEGQRPSIQWGPMLHGVFMRLWPGPLVELLHAQRMHPFTQYLEPRPNGRTCYLARPSAGSVSWCR